MRFAPWHRCSTLLFCHSKLARSHGTDGCVCCRRFHPVARPCGRWWTSFGSTAPIAGSTSGVTPDSALYNPLEAEKPGCQANLLARFGPAHPCRSYCACSAEMLGCEAVLRHISKCFGNAKMYLEPAPSTSFAWLGPGKQVRPDARLLPCSATLTLSLCSATQDYHYAAHETSYVMLKSLRAAPESATAAAAAAAGRAREGARPAVPRTAHS